MTITEETKKVQPSKTHEDKISAWLQPHLDGVEVLRIDIKAIYNNHYRVNVWALVDYVVKVQKSFFLLVDNNGDIKDKS